MGEAMTVIEMKKQRRVRRKRSIRRTLMGTPERPRLTVFRSLKNISAQLIDDLSGKTLCSASTQDKAERVAKGGDCAAAAAVGKMLGERARMQNVRHVVFDRNGYRYHGRVKALAEAARKTGLEF